MDLSDEQLELIIQLADQYLDETPDLNQKEWSLAQSIIDEAQYELDRGYE
jgi:hypothetical protein